MFLRRTAFVLLGLLMGCATTPESVVEQLVKRTTIGSVPSATDEEVALADIGPPPSQHRDLIEAWFLLCAPSQLTKLVGAVAPDGTWRDYPVLKDPSRMTWTAEEPRRGSYRASNQARTLLFEPKFAWVVPAQVCYVMDDGVHLEREEHFFFIDDKLVAIHFTYANWVREFDGGRTRREAGLVTPK